MSLVVLLNFSNKITNRIYILTKSWNNKMARKILISNIVFKFIVSQFTGISELISNNINEKIYYYVKTAKYN